jgi:hypothetical protein
VGRKRIAGLQLTPQLIPVSYVAAEVAGSGSRTPVRLRFGGEADAAMPGRIRSKDAEKLRPARTLLFMEASTPEAVAIRYRDIEVLRTAREESSLWKALLIDREAILRYLEEERSHYLVAVIHANGGAFYLSPTLAAHNDAKIQLEVPFVVGEIHPNTRFWAFGSSVGFTRFPDRRPFEVPQLDLLSNFPRVSDPQNGGRPRRALPVVDPLVILRGTAQRYSEACDRYLRHVGDLHPGDGVQDAGPHAFYLSRVAKFLESISPDALRDFDAKRALPRAEAFTKKYLGEAKDSDAPESEGLKQLIEAREQAAHDLITWLDSESLALMSPLSRNEDGSFDNEADEQAYIALVDARLLALSRLTESERGKHYLSHALDRLGSRSHEFSADLISEYVLPIEAPSGVSLELGTKVAVGVVSLWTKLVPFILERVAKGAVNYAVGGSVYARVNTALVKLTDQISYVFNGRVFQILDPVRSTIQIFAQNRLADLHVSYVELRLHEKQLAASSRAGNVLGGCLEVLNASIAFASCWEAARDEKYDLKSLGSGITLLKSLNFFAEQGTKALMKRAIGDGLKLSLAKIGPRLSMVSTTLDIVGSGVNILESYRSGDYDAAAAEFVAARIGLIALSVPGPVGWSLLALSFGAGLLVDWFKDSAFDRLAKFSAFGNRTARLTSKMNESDLAWAMTTSYAHWNPNTREGVETWILAATQLAYGFSVRGFTPSAPDPAVGYVQIEAQQLLPSTRIHVEVEGEYVNPGRTVMERKHFSAKLWLVFLLDTPAMIDFSGTLKAEAAVRVRDGRIIELELEQILPYYAKPRYDKQVLPMVLYNLTCKVRLDVHGDGDPAVGGENGCVVVPTTPMGKKWVKAKVLEEYRTREGSDARLSNKMGDLC